jgi:hypothetical protein
MAHQQQIQKQEQKQQPIQQQQFPQNPQQQRRQKRREGKATVTRVLDDLLVFVEVQDDEAIGLVFKPRKINDYGGESLASLGFVVGATIPAITWDAETLEVFSVQPPVTRNPPATMGA